MSLIGFTKSLAREGAKYNISAVAIAPVAASAMTATIMSPEMLANLKVCDVEDAIPPCINIIWQPEFVAPFVAAVCHPDGPNPSGRVFEIGAGFITEIRWERSKGTVWKTDDMFTPSAVSQLDTCPPQ
jgi:multifunctional beta-oxidation protein